MTSGIRVNGSSGSVLISDMTYSAFLGGRATPVSRTSSVDVSIIEYSFRSSRAPIPAVRTTSNTYTGILSTSRRADGSWKILVAIYPASASSPDVFCFVGADELPAPSGSHGLVVYDSTGKKTFDSRLVGYCQPSGFHVITTPALYKSGEQNLVCNSSSTTPCNLNGSGLLTYQTKAIGHQDFVSQHVEYVWANDCNFEWVQRYVCKQVMRSEYVCTTDWFNNGATTCSYQTNFYTECGYEQSFEYVCRNILVPVTYYTNNWAIYRPLASIKNGYIECKWFRFAAGSFGMGGSAPLGVTFNNVGGFYDNYGGKIPFTNGITNTSASTSMTFSEDRYG